jgi:hypothetical protein
VTSGDPGPTRFDLRGPLRRTYLWRVVLFAGLAIVFPAYLMLRDPTPVDSFLMVLAILFTVGAALSAAYNLGYALGWTEADEKGLRNSRIWSS